MPVLYYINFENIEDFFKRQQIIKLVINTQIANKKLNIKVVSSLCPTKYGVAAAIIRLCTK